jgi:hypothetical protein
MSTLPDDRDVPDDVPTADYLDQQTVADPDADLTGDDDLSAAATHTSQVEAQLLDADVEADEADLLDQATRVPPADDEPDESV